ncbi:unnamed protein product, partial [Aureobasidium pullulans]
MASNFKDDSPDTIGPETTPKRSFSENGRRIVKAFTTKEGLVGDYDYAFLFKPQLPFMKRARRAGPFFGLNDKMPVFLALLLGFQHALAMLAGIITPPIILSGSANLIQADQQYLVSACLIMSGILSMIQISRIHIWKSPYYVGTGLISVVGTSFATIPVATGAFSQMYATGFCPSDADGNPLPCPNGYGALIATSCVCALLEILMSFTPPRILKKIFPPIVTGPTVMLIGVSLISSGFENWAGGSGSCAGIDAAPVANFIWVRTFKLQVYGPLVLPLLTVYIVLAMEAIGDITASCDVSRLQVDGAMFNSRIQGGVLADGLNGLIAALTRCANRKAGYAACFWLLIMGIFSKFAAALVAIPSSVLGGMTTFLFASVATSGLRIISTIPFTRRNRFILAAAFAPGFGATLVPTYVFTYSGSNQALLGFFNAIVLVMEEGFALAAFIALILNLILPEEMEDEEIPELTANTIDAPADEEEWRHIRREDESEKIAPVKE